MDMRIIVTGDRAWHAPELAESVLNRLVGRYGPSIVIVHGAATGIDRSFAEACGEIGIEQEAHEAHWNELDHPQAVIRHDKRGGRITRTRGRSATRRWWPPVRRCAWHSTGQSVRAEGRRIVRDVRPRQEFRRT